MGYASAGHNIFDPVMKELMGCDSLTRYMVALILIKALQADDWDTEDESLEIFAEDHAIVRAFAECGVTLEGR